MEFFDSHTHLTDEIYDKSVEQIVNDAKLNNVNYIVDIGYNESTSSAAVKNAEMFEGVYATVGLHPENVDEYTGNFDYIYELAKSSKVVAIGEIGLDYHYDNSDEHKAKQKELFIKQIEIANELDLPVVIHSRDADMDMLEILKTHTIKNNCVMHCFSSSVEVLKEVLKLGCYVSIAGPVTFKNARSLIDVAKLIPEDKLLIETDAPYLAPEPFRGKKNSSKYLKYVAEKISSILEISVENVSLETTKNACSVFDLD